MAKGNLLMITTRTEAASLKKLSISDFLEVTWNSLFMLVKYYAIYEAELAICMILQNPLSE